MSYEVIARKYRPQQFDVVDKSTWSERYLTLSQAVALRTRIFLSVPAESEKPHRRIFAKALNCINGPTERRAINAIPAKRLWADAVWT